MSVPLESKQRVAGWLKDAGCFKIEVSPEACHLVAANIDNWKSKPLTVNDIAKMEHFNQKMRGEHLQRKRVARLLEDESRLWRRSGGDLRIHDEAIELLRAPCVELDSHGAGWRLSRQGPKTKPWAYMATMIAGWVVQSLRYLEEPMPAFGESSPIVVFTDTALRFIGVNPMPARKTLANHLGMRLAQLLKDWPPGILSDNTG
jgi:hypothetical protein